MIDDIDSEELESTFNKMFNVIKEQFGKDYDVEDNLKLEDFASIEELKSFYFLLRNSLMANICFHA